MPIYQSLRYTVHKNLGIRVIYTIMYDMPILWKVIYMYISNLHKRVLLLHPINQEVSTEDIKYSLTKSAHVCRWITSVLSIVHTYRRSNRANADEKKLLGHSHCI